MQLREPFTYVEMIDTSLMRSSYRITITAPLPNRLRFDLAHQHHPCRPKANDTCPRFRQKEVLYALYDQLATRYMMLRAHPQHGILLEQNPRLPHSSYWWGTGKIRARDIGTLLPTDHLVEDIRIALASERTYQIEYGVKAYTLDEVFPNGFPS